MRKGQIEEIKRLCKSPENREQILKILQQEGDLEDIREDRKNIYTSHPSGWPEELLEKSQEFIALTTENGIIRHLNPGGKKMLGIPLKKDIAGINITQFFTAPGQKSSWKSIWINVKKNGSWNGYGELKHQKTGNSLPVKIHSFKLKETVTDGTGSLVFVCTDISELQERKKELEQEKHFRDYLLQTSPLPIQILDEKGTILYTNRPLIPGQDNPVGKKCYQVYRKNRQKCRECPVGKPVKEGEVVRVLIDDFIDGRIREVSHRGIRLKNGRPGILEFFLDKTDEIERKRKYKDKNRALQTILNNVSDVIWEVNVRQGDPKHGMVTFTSRSAYYASGYKPQEFLTNARKWWKIIHPGDKEAVREQTIKAIKTGRRVKRSYRLKHKKTGEYHWIEDIVKPLKEGGKVVAILGVARDVTKDHLINAALQESETRFKALARLVSQNTFSGVFDNTGHIKFHFFTGKPATFIGYTEEELNRPGIMNRLLFAEDIDLALHQIKRLKTNKTVRFSTRLRHKNGKTVWAQFILKPVYNPDLKKVTGFEGLISDITREKETANRLKESEQQYRQLFATSPLPMMVIQNSLIMDINRAALKLVGISSRKTVLNRRLSEFIAPSYRKKTLASIRETLKTGKVSKPGLIQIKHDHKPGPVLVEANAVPVLYKGSPAVLSTFRDVTLQHRQAEKLRKSEEKYRQLVENSPLPIGIHINGIMHYVNPACIRLMRAKSPKQIIGKPAIDFVHPDDLEKVRTRVATGIKLKKAQPPIHERFITLDGKTVDVEVTALPIEIEGKPGMQLIMRDITETLKARKQLEASEEKYRTVFKTSPDAVNINRLEDGLYVEINEGFTKITGFTEADVLGKTSAEIGIWYNYSDRKKLVKGLKEKGYYENLEAPFQMKDGSLRTGLMSAKVFYLDGEPHILSITRDITEWKKTENLFEQIINSAPSGILIVDEKGNIIKTNKAISELTGYPLEELPGKPVEILLPENRAEHHIRQRELFHKSGNQSLHVVGKIRTGRQTKQNVPVDLRLSRFNFQNQIFYLVIINDISSQVRAEQMIKQSLREKEAMLHELHHRVKNNMQVISGLLQFQADKTTSEEAKSVLRESQNQIIAMSMVHEQLYQAKDMAKIEMKPYLISLTQGIVSSFGADPAKFRVKVFASDVILPVKMAIPLGLVINELITNSFKHGFTGKSSGEITLKMFIRDQHVHLQYRDNGKPLPPDFDINTSTGTGTLLIRLLIVDQLNGKVKAMGARGAAINIQVPMTST